MILYNWRSVKNFNVTLETFSSDWNRGSNIDPIKRKPKGIFWFYSELNLKSHNNVNLHYIIFYNFRINSQANHRRLNCYYGKEYVIRLENLNLQLAEFGK